MSDDELLERVRQLRAAGGSPKGIARRLGLRPAQVAPLVRRVAAEAQAGAGPADRAVLGCWINRGWSAGLGLDDAPGWAGFAEPASGTGTEGMVQVLVARQERASRVAVCGYLLDTYCLGAKNGIGPVSMGRDSLDSYRAEYFSAYDDPPLDAPIELARQLVHGAVDYARGLGFEPHADFAAAAPYLGAAEPPTAIRFGRDGEPFYVAGPRDNAAAVIRTLQATVGADNFHYIAPL